MECYGCFHSEFIFEANTHCCFSINSTTQNTPTSNSHCKLFLNCFVCAYRRNGPESQITQVMATDMVNAGIDTTGNTLAFLIYNLARNPGITFTEVLKNILNLSLIPVLKIS